MAEAAADLSAPQPFERAIPAADLLAAVLPHAAAIGVTRFANITGLDYVGLPVFLGVRPRSRNFTVVQGKGLTEPLARLGCFCEALESFCAESPRFPTRMLTPAAAAARGPVLAPAVRARRPLADDAVVCWAEAECLLTDTTMQVPVDLLLSDFGTPPPPGHGHFWPTTNGVGAGTGRDEAVLHGLCELVERDAFAHFAARRSLGRPVTAVALDATPGWPAAALAERLRSLGIAVELYDITTDLGVPAYACTIDDAAAVRRPCLGRFSGFGCHPDAEIAAARALIEAVQCRLTIIAGSRDDIPAAAYLAVSWGAGIAAQLEPAFVVGRRVPIATAGPPLPTDPPGAVAAILERLRAAGIRRLCVADLASPVPALVCVRVLCGALEGMIDRKGYSPGPRLRRLLAEEAD